MDVLSQQFELSEDNATNKTANPTMGDIINARMGKRDFMKGMLAVAAVAAAPAVLLSTTSKQALAAGMGRFNFDEIIHGVDETHHVAKGYNADVLIRWGDKLFADATDFDPYNQTEESQLKQFGYNNDYVGFLPLDGERGLLCVNHEYTNEELMFPGLGKQDRDAKFSGMTSELIAVEMAAHGGTIVEIMKEGEGWKVDTSSKYNRRITAKTPMEITGTAAGHKRMQTKADPSGNKVLGTINNCAGGMTPWGTYLMAEENFNGYFWNKDAAKTHDESAQLKRYGAPGEWYAWGKFDDRFDIEKEPNEVNRFGWVVEVDPMDPTSMPKKRTALGRFKHEGAESIVNKDNRVVVYMGDDQRGDYLYKFISARKVTGNRKTDMNLLDDGTLYVAKFEENGDLNWLALIFGEGPLTSANGFWDQGDVLVSTRIAADFLGATKMDRPEDVQPNPVTGKVYVMLTNNKHRGEKYPTDAANPRKKNPFGHIIEITPDDQDHASVKDRWSMLIMGGDPSKPEVGALWNEATSANGWFAAPDNAAVDHQGRLWVTTDQGKSWPKSGTADGVWAMETEGQLRGTGKMFFRVPVGAEMCGPVFTPDDQTLFIAVQHPAADGVKSYPGFERNSTFEDPATRWPDFENNTPPRPSVVVITKKGGGIIGV